MTEEKKNRPLKLEDLQDLDLKPQWAQKDSDKVSVVKGDGAGNKGGRDRRQGDKRGGRSDGSRGRSSNEKRGRRPDAKQSSDRRPPKGDRERGMSKGGGKNDSRGRKPVRDRREEKTADLPLKISFLPERRGLGVIVRRVRSTKKAYALPAIADLFLGKPDYYLIKVEVEDKNFKLYQCGLCKELFQSESTARSHLFDEHAEHYFDVETVETEPPAGNFPVMAKCGLSGELLGPPNHHTYRRRLRDVHARRYPDMPIAKYEQRIETTDDEEVIEQWKQENSKKIQYKLKDSPEGDPMDKDQARAYLGEHYAGKDIHSNTRFVLPATAAWKTKDKDLFLHLKRAWDREKKFPITLIHALRPALRHMKLNIFKVGKKATFVCAVQPAPIDPEHSVSHIKEELDYIQKHPRCSREDMLKGLCGEEPENSEKRDKILKSLHWLVDCGHVVEFADGSLSVPIGRNRVVQ